MWAIAGSLQYHPLTTATTDWLSQWQQTVSPLQDAPHMAVATMIGSNSFAAIDAAAKLGEDGIYGAETVARSGRPSLPGDVWWLSP